MAQHHSIESQRAPRAFGGGVAFARVLSCLGHVPGTSSLPQAPSPRDGRRPFEGAHTRRGAVEGTA